MSKFTILHKIDTLSIRLNHIFFALLVTILCISFYAKQTDIQQLKDGYEYTLAKQNWVEHNVLYSGELIQKDDMFLYEDYRQLSKRTFGYPLFLAFNQFGNHHLGVVIFQILLICFSFFVGLSLLKRLKANKQGFVVFGILFFLTISLLTNANYIMADILLMACLSLMVLLYFEKKYTALAVFWSLGLLIKPVMLPSVIIATGLFIYLLVKKKRVLGLLLPLLVAVAVSWINFSKTGVFQYSSISTINMINYNAKLTVANQYGSDSAEQYVSGEMFKHPNSKQAYVKYNKSLNSKASSTLLNHFGTYLKLHLLGGVKSVVDPGRFELYSFMGIEDGSVSLTEILAAGSLNQVFEKLNEYRLMFYLFMAFTIISLIKLLGFVIGSIGMVKERIVLIFVVLYFIGIAGPIGAGRFLIPALILYLVLASLGLGRILNRFQKTPKG